MDYYSDYSTYDYTSSYASSDATSGLLAGLAGGMMLFFWAITIFMLVCMIKIYTKAGRKWWEAIVPIYNIIVLLEIVQLPLWYIALLFIPFANIYVLFKVYIELAHKFGKSTGFGVAMVFFGVICMPMLAFGKSTYQGEVSQMPNYNSQPTQPNFGPQPVNQQPVQPSFGPQPINQQPIQPTITPQYTNQPIINNPGVVQPEPSPVAGPALNTQTQNIKFCPNCGTQQAITNTICSQCGHNI